MGSDIQFWAPAAKALGHHGPDAGLTSLQMPVIKAPACIMSLLLTRLTTPQIFHTFAATGLVVGAVTRSLVGNTVDCLYWIGKGRGE